MTIRKASLGLDSLQNSKADIDDTKLDVEKIIDREVKKNSKKIMIPYYVDPLLHDALHTIVFAERQQRTSFQTLISEGLDTVLKKKGLPSIDDIISGGKKINI